MACWRVGGHDTPGFAGSGTAAASPSAQTFCAPSTRRWLVDADPPAWVEGQAELGDDRGGRDARRPHDDPGREPLARRQGGAVVRDLLHARAGQHLDPPGAQLARHERPEPLGRVAHELVLRLDEQPAHPLPAAQRVQAHEVLREVLHLADRRSPA
jgi:hypothetical protein